MDRDTQLLEEVYKSIYTEGTEGIFAGIVDESDDDPTDDEGSENEKTEETEEKDEDESSDESEGSDDDDDEEKDESSEEESEDEEDEEESDDDSSDNPFASDDSEDDSDGDDDSDESEEDGDNPEGAGGDKGVQSKVQALQKQYNDILVDAFTKYAPDCIEDALEGADAAFGEDIEGVLQGALDSLKTKILGDFGIESGAEGMIGPMGMGQGPMGMGDEVGSAIGAMSGEEEPMGGITLDLGDGGDGDEVPEGEEVEESNTKKGRGYCKKCDKVGPGNASMDDDSDWVLRCDKCGSGMTPNKP